LDAVGHDPQAVVVGLLGVGRQRLGTVRPVLALIEAGNDPMLETPYWPLLACFGWLGVTRMFYMLASMRPRSPRP
jgi:hypothetical protein